MKLTIAVDDISIPLPPMTLPDIRQRILEQVIELAARKGVEDVQIVVATALHRRMTADEIRRMVGERVFRPFWPKDLFNFDGEDKDALTEVGTTDEHEVVETRSGPRSPTLLVYVNVNLVAMDGGHKSVAIGLAGYRSLQAPPQRGHDDALALLHGYPPRAQRDRRLRDADGQADRRARPEGVPDRDHRELRDLPQEPRLPEQARVGVVRLRPGLMIAARKANGMAPPRVRREFYRRVEAPYKLTGSTPARSRRSTSGRSRTCTGNSWSRSVDSPTSWCSDSRTWAPTT